MTDFIFISDFVNSVEPLFPLKIYNKSKVARDT